MSDIRIGDIIQTLDPIHLTKKSTQVIGFLEKRQTDMTNYIKLDLDNRDTLYISLSHIMFIADNEGHVKDVHAKEVKAGSLYFH